MGFMPCDVEEGKNLSLWQDAAILNRVSGVQLKPLEAKALHVMGLLLLNFDAAGHLLISLSNYGQLSAHYYLQAYLLACTAIELLAYCESGQEDLIKGSSRKALELGLEKVGLVEVHTNHPVDNEDDEKCNEAPTNQPVGDKDGKKCLIYRVPELVALRNLVAHGQGEASYMRQPAEAPIVIELLDTFPKKMLRAFDDYYTRLFEDDGEEGANCREMLAKAGVKPIHYDGENVQEGFLSPLEYAYEVLIQAHKRPSEAAENTDWQVLK